MADGIRGVTAISQDVVEGFEPGDGLVLAEGAKQVRKFILRDSKFADGFRQRYKHRMARSSAIAGFELCFPLVEERERGGGVANFITEVVGDAAIGVHVEEMLAQAARQKPSGNREI